MSQQPYVSRPEAEDFLAALDAALKSPKDSPTVFNAWGIGGVGKSTLTRKAKEIYEGTAKIAEVSFGLTEGINEPIPLMAKLYEQIAVKDSWSRDPFWEKYELYFETAHQLSTQAAAGWGAATPEQVNQVKQLLKLGVDAIGEFTLSESGKKTANTLVDKGMDAAVAGLSLKDSLQQLLQQHKATKRNQELQRLMLEPLPQLTQAFAQGLSQQAKQQPIVLVLDTYEKAPGVIDTWLWRTLLGNTDLSAHPVRLMVAGRHSLLKTEGWRKLHQDRDVIRDLTVERFTPEQTQAYLAQIGMTDETQVDNICRVTRGLPYYLNWIREQSEKGRNLDFDQGNQEIVRLLLQGLNETQKRVVQLAACCRWFDSKIIRYLTEQQGLDFATAVDEGQNCYGWLTQLSFAEPIAKRWRLDDVARDVFRKSLERDELATIHSDLAERFVALSEQLVSLNSSPAENYKNPEWLELRSEYLYHLFFAGPVNFQLPFLSHLLEARFFNSSEIFGIPFLAITAEFELDDHPLLGYQQRQFLKQVRPAVLYGWAVLEEYPIDYPYNEEHFNLSKAETDQAVSLCLGNVDQFQGLAQVLACCYRSGRCWEHQRSEFLLRAYEKARQLSETEPLNHWADLFLYELGNRFYEINQFEAAISSYEAALALQPDKHEALWGKGSALNNLGRCEEAITAYDAALVINSNYYAVWTNKGTAFENLGKYKEALSCHEKALAIKSDDDLAWYNKGVQLNNLGRYEEAIAAYDAALAIKPDHPDALNNKGFALDELGRYEEAIVAYDAALAIQPDHLTALINKGNALGKLGRYEAAIAPYEAALAIQPDYPEALNNKGNALFNLGRYEEAIAAYDAALEIKPDKEEAFYNKACCYGLQGKVELVLENLERAVQLNPEEYREMAKTDADFDAIREDPRFQALVGGNEG